MRQRLQLNFADSSDDDHAHTADFEVIPDGASTTAERRPGNRTEEANWFSRFMGRAATYLTSAATDPHEPIAEDETRGTAATSSEEGGIFDYGALGPRVDGSSLSSGQSGGDGATAPSPGASFGDAERDQFSVEVDLREAVLQYQRTPMDLYYNIVLATLQSGACRVNGDVMCAAVGYPKLIEAFLNSGVVDLEDVTVQQVVQDELSRVLSGDPWMDDVVDACDGDYLRCLCQVRSARITEPQLVLMRQSGCEIVKIIYDCPHILGNIEVNNGSVTYCILRLLSAGTFSGAWLGIVAFVVFLITVVWITILWLDSDGSRVYGYWTILCAVGGYVLGLVCTVMAEQHKIRTYEDVLWPYPDNHLKVLPFIPVYELVLLVTSMRYELLEDRRPFFIIRWDLRNGIATQQRIHGFFFVLPQTILQCYLYTIHDSSDGARNHWLWALCMSGLVVFYLASLAQIRVVLFTFSSDLFGFAVLAARRRGVLNPRAGKRVMPIRAAMQCCVFFTMNFSVACVAMTFILLVDGSSCRRVAASLLVVFLTVAILSLLMVVLFLLYASKPVSRWMGLFCLPCIILEMFFLIFYNTDPRGEGCRALSLQRWTIPVEITYALTCVSFVIWVIMLMYQSISGSEIEQRALDTFLEKF